MARTRWIQRALSCCALTLLALVAYFQARGATQLLATSLPNPRQSNVPLPPLRRAALLAPHASAAAILARNVFDSITGPLHRPSSPSVPPLARHDVDPLFAPACTQPRVVIVTESPDPVWSVAAFRATDDGPAELHRIGERVMGQRIEFIGFNPVERSPAVWLSNQGELCQALLFPRGSSETKIDAGAASAQAPSAASREAALPLSGTASEIASKIRKLSDTEYEVERSAIDQLLDNQLELTKNVKIVPQTTNGKVVGIRVFGVRAGCVLSLLGIQNGDLLRTINGYDLGDPQSALQMYAQLRRMNALDVRLERRGSPLALSIQIR